MRNGTAPERLRVLHVIIMLGETNGQYNEHCLPLVEARDLSICTYFEPRLAAPPEIDVFPGDGTLRGFSRALRDAFRQKDYDVVHAHAPATAALTLLGLVMQPRRRRLRSSLVYTVQDSFHDYKLRDRLLMLPVFASYRRVVFCGRAARDSYPALWRRIAGGRSRLIPNAADLGRVERATANTSRAANGSFEIISVGRIEPVKDPLTVLTAFQASRDERSRLVFVGAGSLERDLSAAVHAAGLGDEVELAGLIPRDDVFVRCARADLFVSASRGEGLPVAVIEAMASGCPVVLSDIPPHRELVDGADFVPFVPERDPEALAREIERFRAMPPDERRSVGERCRGLTHSRFALETMLARYEVLYREVAA
jgi:glycosyltransferase involved in cell wall biosynthesis